MLDDEERTDAMMESMPTLLVDLSMVLMTAGVVGAMAAIVGAA